MSFSFFLEQIISTQPRKLAARSLAARVAEEYGCQVGEEVSQNVYYLRYFY
jgi:ATP-dependent RNA helicase DHR2